MCLSNQADNRNAMNASVGNTLKLYLGFVSGLRHEIIEPCPGPSRKEGQ